jgi:hypothetical protein
MKFSFAILLGFSTAAISEEYFLKKQLFSLSRLNSELETPLKEAEVHNKIFYSPIV